MSNNKLIIAAAGSGKTTHLVEKALEQKGGKILITTYTEANEAEIRKKIIDKNKCIPENITVLTWFSFLLHYGVRPYQGTFNNKLFGYDIKSQFLLSGQSALFVSEKRNFIGHYFTKDHKIYSDKLAKFVVKANQTSNGIIVDRLSRIYTHIFIDEVQDLAGYDLDFLKLLFSSSINTLLVGDPRQGTYSTNEASKNRKFRKSEIIYFFEDKSVQIKTDSALLTTNYRCTESICNFSNKLFPDLPATKSGNTNTTENDGVHLVERIHVVSYLQKYKPIQLRWNSNTKVNSEYPAMNFGLSKGLTFNRVLIYPTQSFIKWLENNNADFPKTSRAKFYVAITRARYSVGIVYDCDDNKKIEGLLKLWKLTG